ncbi:MAG TPA: menaquinone biosynthesis protein [Armatimonadota bacterium]|nr:menaquinone biosynthesis protein [Armatimonadota bacterium]
MSETIVSGETENGEAPRKVKLAAVSYLNTRPLIAALENGAVPGYEVTRDVPSRLPEKVQSGEADFGLLPMGYCAWHPELTLAPGVGIACRGPVRSILLLTRGMVRDARRIAATNTSMSSVAMLRLLLKHHFGSGAELTSSGEPVSMMEAGDVDGALLIGDPALQVDAGQYRTYDLGEEWFRFSGLPFVFAMWAGPDAGLAERVTPDLVQAMRLGRTAIPSLAEDAAVELGLPPGFCEDYLTNYIIHDVGDAEMEGYALFKKLLRSGS